jgi:PEP-CTERM motif
MRQNGPADRPAIQASGLKQAPTTVSQGVHMSLRHLTLVAAATLGTLAATTASAGSFASASISQFSYTLFDLNTGDGITPSITFSLGGSPYASASQSTATDPASGSQSNSAWSLQVFGPSSVISNIGLGSAQASVSGSPTAGGLTYLASGAALGSTVPSATTQFSASAGAASSNFGQLSFSLAPYTLLVFSGNANLSAQTTIGLNPVGFQSESASASVGLSVSGPSASGGSGFQNASDNRSLNASFTSVFDPTTGQFGYTGQTQTLVNAPLSVAFTNFTPTTLNGQFSLSVSVNGNSPLTPVPEPASAALFLAGLAALAACARRQRRS